MKKNRLWIVLVATLVVLSAIWADPTTDTVSKFSYTRVTLTSTASTVSIPVPTGATVGGIRAIRVISPSSNTDAIRVDMSATASSTSFLIQPGNNYELPFAGGTLSCKSDTGTQVADIIAYYR